MRNLNELTLFCYECEIEITAEEHHAHAALPLRLSKVPWNRRGEWMADDHPGTEQAVFYDEE